MTVLKKALVIKLATLLIAARAHGLMITNDVVINGNDPAYQGADLEVYGCTLALAGDVRLSSLRLGSGAVLTNAPPEPAHLLLTVSNNLEVVSEARVDLTGTGAAGEGGEGTSSAYIHDGVTNTVGSGGGYGGRGGKSIGGGQGGFTVGTVTVKPGSYGSPGGAGGGLGGGRIELRVGGELRLDGRILADGNPATTSGAGGGSGGSIYVAASVLRGRGIISANGGSGHLPFGGGGSGGRIAVEAATNSYLGSITAVGGPGANYGGAGTIWVLDRSVSQWPTIIVDNAGTNGEISNLAGANDAAVVIQNRASVGVELSTTYARSMVVASNSSVVFLFGSPFARSLVVSNDLIVERGGSIAADGWLGYYGYFTEAGARAGSGGGGANSGYGGSSTNGTGGGSAAHFEGRRSMGGGTGAAFGSTGPETSGGGEVQLLVGGRLSLDGAITARGMPGTGLGAGGAAGGFISIQTGVFVGTGTLDASGGDGELPDAGGGGGGAIVITAQTNLFEGVARALGGRGANNGGAGMVGMSGAPGDADRYRVVVDAGGILGTNCHVALAGTNDLAVRGGANAELSLKVRNLALSNGGRLLIADHSNLTSLEFENVDVGPGSGILANGIVGYTSTGRFQGQGQATNVLGEVGGGGGANGGNGGMSAGGAKGGEPWGLPNEKGMGGGRGGYASLPANGGSACLLKVAGCLQLDGFIESNGANGVDGGGGGGGGTVFIEAGSVSGSGTIQANGGDGTAGRGGGGGGGRIVILADTNSFNGAMQAVGGEGFEAGGAGTSYLQSSDRGALLRVDNGGRAGAITPLTATNGSDLRIAGAARVYPVEPLIVTGLEMTTASSVVQSNVTISVSNQVSIDATSRIEASGRGYGPNAGPGAGRFGAEDGSGAGYGGNGGASASGAIGGNAYGDPFQPIEAGSGGGAPDSSAASSAGGGVVRLTAGGSLTLNGRIAADGMDGLTPGAGGGTGGSVYIVSSAMSGDGSISAMGGKGQADKGGAGSGGRIAIYAAADTFTGSISAAGGGGPRPGEAGSIVRAPAARLASVVTRGAKPVLTWRLPAGWQYRVQTSTNLVDWVPLEEPAVKQGDEFSLELSPEESRRFYRVDTIPGASE